MEYDIQYRIYTMPSAPIILWKCFVMPLIKLHVDLSGGW